jgi:flagellar motor switch/type III secretory pathway protein FliN
MGSVSCRPCLSPLDARVQRAPEIRAYPWDALDIVPREAAHLLRDARRAVRRAIDERKIGESLSELLGEHVSIIVGDVNVAAANATPLHGATLTFATADDAVRVELDVEHELSRTLVARVVGRPTRLGDPRLPLAPEIEGGLAAIACSVARRAHGAGETLRPVGSGALRLAPGERRIDVHATVLIGADAYAARATIQMRRTFTPETADPASELASLGKIPISMPVVAAISLARTIDVYGLEPGDVWMPGDGWSVRRAGDAGGRGASAIAGEILLAAPGTERAIRARLGENGEIVVVGVETTQHDAEAKPMSEHDPSATSEVALDAPLVVRVELGAVTMSAREWAALRPGDVVAVGRRVSEPVVLRIAGMEVARGELVDIEGELGVRIREQVKSA